MFIMITVLSSVIDCKFSEASMANKSSCWLTWCITPIKCSCSNYDMFLCLWQKILHWNLIDPTSTRFPITSHHVQSVFRIICIFRLYSIVFRLSGNMSTRLLQQYLKLEGNLLLFTTKLV